MEVDIMEDMAMATMARIMAMAAPTDLMPLRRRLCHTVPAVISRPAAGAEFPRLELSPGCGRTLEGQ